MSVEKWAADYLTAALAEEGIAITARTWFPGECDEPWRESLNETRPGYILAIRAQALDAVQAIIQPDEDGPWVEPPIPTREQWDAIVEAAFPPPPMA
jgi:hypothetical protein